MEIRAGVHTGECEVMGDKLGGIAVHIDARVLAQAAPGEVLVSATVKDLVASSGIQLEERCVHQLKGVQANGGCWRHASAVIHGEAMAGMYRSRPGPDPPNHAMGRSKTFQGFPNCCTSRVGVRHLSSRRGVPLPCGLRRPQCVGNQ
jgi:hypothetical protein